MVDPKETSNSGGAQKSDSEAKAQLGDMLSGIERSLAVTCESIMGKMRDLEQKIQDMEKKYTDLAKDAEQALKEADSVEKVQNGVGDENN